MAERARAHNLETKLRIAMEVAAPAAIRYVIEEAARRTRLIVETAAGRETAAPERARVRPDAKAARPSQSATGWWHSFVAAWDRDYPTWRELVPPALLRLASQRSGRGSLYSDLNREMHDMNPLLAYYVINSITTLDEFVRRAPDLADVARVLPPNDPAIPTRREARASLENAAFRRAHDVGGRAAAARVA